MGKGDMKTKRGKRIRGSYGKVRPRQQQSVVKQTEKHLMSEHLIEEVAVPEAAKKETKKAVEEKAVPEEAKEETKKTTKKEPDKEK